METFVYFLAAFVAGLIVAFIGVGWVTHQEVCTRCNHPVKKHHRLYGCIAKHPRHVTGYCGCKAHP
jgi:hypothetical protein